jgi:lipoate-protein ligase B
MIKKVKTSRKKNAIITHIIHNKKKQRKTKEKNKKITLTWDHKPLYTLSKTRKTQKRKKINMCM